MLRIASTRRRPEETVFRRRKGPDETPGFNRISRLIEDRQRELDDSDVPEVGLEEDTIVLDRADAPAARTEQDGHLDDEGESVSLLGIRNPVAQTGNDSSAMVERAWPGAEPGSEGWQATDSPEGARPTAPEADTQRYSADAPRPMPVPNITAAPAGASLVA